MPKTIQKRELIDIFQGVPAYLYYSLYSIEQSFRDHWLPNAMPYLLALEKLKKFQEITSLPITFHWAIISGHNDDLAMNTRMAALLKSYNFNGRFSLVQYNPHPNSQSSESSESRQKEILKIYESVFPKSKQIPRVGFDVKASCGMFVQ
jgi:adenine C2-methylase RlmN of 23S rRNA A2503 and tRNA A37